MNHPNERTINKLNLPGQVLPTLILNFRDLNLILYRDLGRIYRVQTKVLNQAVKHNHQGATDHFVIDLTREKILRISHTVTTLVRLKFFQQMRAFTERGALQAANILSSPLSGAMSMDVNLASEGRMYLRVREILTLAGDHVPEEANLNSSVEYDNFAAHRRATLEADSEAKAIKQLVSLSKKVPDRKRKP